MVSDMIMACLKNGDQEEKHLGKSLEQGRKKWSGEKNVTRTKGVKFSKVVNGQLNETE